MSKTSTITIHFKKGDNEFTSTFSGCNVENLETADEAKSGFINNYKGIVDGDVVSFDFAVVEKGIEY